MSLSDLPALTDRPRMAIPKGKTRLELQVDERPLIRIDEKAFKAAVWKRDLGHCRCCGRKVQKVLGRVPDRGEVNHLHGRTGDLRFEVKAACLLCLTCHERFTGRVNAHRLIVIASQTFTIRQGTFTDATYPITFQEVA